jgi:hypothetical protein
LFHHLPIAYHLLITSTGHNRYYTSTSKQSNMYQVSVAILITHIHISTGIIVFLIPIPSNIYSYQHIPIKFQQASGKIRKAETKCVSVLIKTNTRKTSHNSCFCSYQHNTRKAETKCCNLFLSN